MQLELFKLDELRAAEYNPRVALEPKDPEFQKIARSIKYFGYCDPIIINKDKTIIGGHQRATVMKWLGMEEAQCVVVDLDKEKEKALNIALNKITGRWDQEKLAELLADLSESDLDVSITGFDNGEVSDLLATLEVPPGDDADFDEEAAEAETEIEGIRTKTGDIWLLGKHRLMCGDSTKAEDVQKLVGGHLADLYLTDPPYNVAYEGKTKDKLTIKNDHMEDGTFLEFLKAAFSAADAAMRPGAVWYIWHADLEGYNFRGAVRAIGWQIRECLIWLKNTMVLGRQDYQWRHEPCLYGWKEGAGHKWFGDRTQTTTIETTGAQYNGDKTGLKEIQVPAYELETTNNLAERLAGPKVTIAAKNTKTGKAVLFELPAEYEEIIVGGIDEVPMNTSSQKSILYFKKPNQSKEHPTMKPVDLFSYQIENSSHTDDIVLDSFGGSGTTIIACEQLSRKARVMELDPKYCDVIIKRWQNLTRKDAVLESTGQKFNDI